MRALQPKEHEICGMKICVMIRVQRLFNVSLANESFTAMLHVVTCWLAVNDAANDAMDSEFEHEQAGKFVCEQLERIASSPHHFVAASPPPLHRLSTAPLPLRCLSAASLPPPHMRCHADDADPDLAFYEPDFRPRIRVRNLSEGEAALDGSSVS